jgi:hypothetical protein
MHRWSTHAALLAVRHASRGPPQTLRLPRPTRYRGRRPRSRRRPHLSCPVCQHHHNGCRSPWRRRHPSAWAWCVARRRRGGTSRERPGRWRSRAAVVRRCPAGRPCPVRRCVSPCLPCGSAAAAPQRASPPPAAHWLSASRACPTLPTPDTLRAGALRHMGIGLGLGVVAAAAWASIARSNHREWEKIKRVRGNGQPPSAPARDEPPRRWRDGVRPAPAAVPTPRWACRPLQADTARHRESVGSAVSAAGRVLTVSCNLFASLARALSGGRRTSRCRSWRARRSTRPGLRRSPTMTRSKRAPRGRRCLPQCCTPSSFVMPLAAPPL